MFDVLKVTQDNLIGFRVEGKIEKADYEKLQALLDKTEREYDKLKLYIEIGKIEGMTLQALWEDFKTYFGHIKKFSKVAVIGSGGIDKILTKLTNPFVSAEVRFFSLNESHTARDWIMGELVD